MCVSRDDHEAVKLGWIHAFLSSTGRNMKGPELVAKLMVLKGISDHERHKTTKDYAVYAVRIGYTEEQFQHCLAKARKEGVDLSADWLVKELYEAFADDMADRYRQAHPLGGRMRNSSSTASSTSDGEINLRPVVIDGCNVGLAYGGKMRLDCEAFALCVEFFKKRGHSNIKIVLPSYIKEERRMSKGRIIVNHEVLSNLHSYIFWTPSTNLGGTRIICYDDRYIIKLATDLDGIIVSNDGYRDLIDENEKLRPFIEERVLMFIFVGKKFIVPMLPFGHSGRTIDSLLSLDHLVGGKPCPYKDRCTYGNNCKYSHFEQHGSPICA